MRSIYDVVIMPPRFRGDDFAAPWAASLLAFPKIKQRFPTPQRGRHRAREALFEIKLPARVIRVDLAIDLDMTRDLQTVGGK